jgi:hypothetical protein
MKNAVPPAASTAGAIPRVRRLSASPEPGVLANAAADRSARLDFAASSPDMRAKGP